MSDGYVPLWIHVHALREPAFFPAGPLKEREVSEEQFDDAQFLSDVVRPGWKLIAFGPLASPVAVKSTDIGEESDIQILAVEPSSWSVILSYAIEKAKEAIVSMVLNAFVSALFGKRVKIETLLRDLLTQVAALIAQKLREEALREAKANATALQKGIEIYSAQRQRDVFLLANLTTEASKTVEQLKSLGLQGTSAYTFAAACEIIILLERHSISKEIGLWTLAQEYTRTIKENLTALDAELTTETSQRFSTVTNRYEKRSSGPPGTEYESTEQVPIYYYTLDGREIAASYNRGDIEKSRARHIRDLQKDLRQKIIAPALAITNELTSLTAGDPPNGKAA